MARKDLGALGDADIVSELAGKQHDLVKAQFALSMNRLQNTSSLRKLRREIAQLNTELRRREIANGLAKNTLSARHRVSGPVVRAAGEASGAGFLAGVVDKIAE